MKNTHYYKAFVAQTPEEILRSVFKKKEDILIAISLNNGGYVEGIILDLKEDNNHNKSVCLLSPQEEVAFLNLHSIAMITIKQPKKMVVELSKGVISRPLSSENENLTVLQLKRWLQSEKSLLGSQIKEFDINDISLSEINTRLNIQDVFTALKSAIHQIVTDELGKEAWQGVDTIILQQADKLDLKYQGETITISIPIDKALPEKLATIFEEKLLQIL
ncbi:hypothetical protein H0I29_03155 [Polaribacter sp. R2A056_3_33]|uniref:hypothetical protein n=1 Tax=Polaribacter sp. R2A056_3_33 TaxID=2745563 RepID=UPI001C50268F|nr:hypothetical protein [Polaribacter sp. R2A056_3_33]QXP71107.1 hypothetical protein H0I29_03155 [Polaribacter sp. R2A056_3_33]